MICNIIVVVKRILKCCVLFLVYFNDFVVLCRNGVCGYFLKLVLFVYGIEENVIRCSKDVLVMLFFYGVFIFVLVN